MFEIGAELAFVPVLSQSFSQIYAELQNCLLTRAGVTVYFNAQVRIPRRLCIIMGEERQRRDIKEEDIRRFPRAFPFPMTIFIVTAVNVIHVLTCYIFHHSLLSDSCSVYSNCRMRYFFLRFSNSNEILMDANRYRGNVYESAR